MFTNPFSKVFEAQKREQDKTAKKETCNKAQKEAYKVYSDNPFSVEYKGIHTGSKGLKFAANAVSVFAAFFCFSELLGSFLGAYAGYALAAVATLLLEYLKNKAFGAFFKNYYKYRNFNIVAFGVAILLSILSLASSGYGAYMIPLRASEAKPFEYIPTASDSAVIGQIEQLETRVSALVSQATANQTNTHRGKVTRTALKANTALYGQIEQLETERSELEKERTGIREKAEKAASENKVEKKEALAFMQLCAVCAAIAFELLYFACMLFGYYYLFRAFLESEEGQIEQPRKRQTEQPEPVEPTEPTEPTEPIEPVEPIEQPKSRPEHTTAKGQKPIGFNNPKAQEDIFKLKNNFFANRTKARKYKKEGKIDLAKSYIERAKEYKEQLAKQYPSYKFNHKADE